MIEDVVRRVREGRGENLDLREIPPDDPKTYALLVLGRHLRGLPAGKLGDAGPGHPPGAVAV